ncbi:MAG: hypothetical protein R3C32_03945 [Chloroflexota bacterium]
MSASTATLAPTDPERGLSTAEVESRRAAGLNNTPPPPTTRTYAQIVRENVFTFLNNVLFLMGVALIVVGRPIDALVSVGVIFTNIIVSVVQEVRAKRTLDRVTLLHRPTASVVRDGTSSEVPPTSWSWATCSRSGRATRSCSTDGWPAAGCRSTSPS